MNKNEKFVITINRELGSGGSTVGHKLAERLGVPFYNKIIIETLTDKYNLSKEEIENLKGRGRSWWSDFKFAVGIGAGLSRDSWTLRLLRVARAPKPPCCSHSGFYGLSY